MDDQKRHARRRTVAKKWRDTESTYISQLLELLPYPDSIKSRMNKLEIMRLVKTFIYAKELDDELDGTLESLSKANMIMDALNGFLMSVDQDGLILFVSEHIYQILGHHSYRMIGNNIKDYVHKDDTERFFRHLKPATANDEFQQEQRFVVRMNYRITENSNKVKQSGYVGVHLRGTLKTHGCNGVKAKEAVLVAGCYIPCVSPCVQLNYFESNYVMRFDKNDRLSYVENWIYDCWGVKARPFIGDHVKVMFNPADIKEWCAPYMFFQKRGVMVVSFHVITRAGHVFHGVTHDTMVFGPKGEKLFWVAVRYVNRVGKVEIKHWPGKQDLIVIGHSYGLPGEEDKRRPINSHVEDITDNILPKNKNEPEAEADTSCSEYGNNDFSSSPKDVTLAEVNGAKTSVKDLLFYSEESEKKISYQELLADEDMGIEEALDSSQDLKAVEESEPEMTMHDFLDSQDMVHEARVTDLLDSEIDDTMVCVFNSEDDTTPCDDITDGDEIPDDNSTDITVLGDVCLSEAIGILSPSNALDGFDEYVPSDDQSAALSHSTDNSNEYDAYNITEMEELSSNFPPDIMDFVLKDDYQMECQMNSSKDGELTLRELLLKS